MSGAGVVAVVDSGDGGDEVASLLGAATSEDVHVRLGRPGGDETPDCVVAVSDDSDASGLVERLSSRTDAPVVAYGGAPDRVLAAGASVVVRRAGDGDGTVLANRVRSVLDGSGPSLDRAADGGRIRREFGNARRVGPAERALDRIADPVVSVDRDWRITYANEGALEASAISGPLQGKSIWTGFPDAEATFRDGLERLVRTGTSGTIEAYYEPAGTDVTVSAYPDGSGLTLVVGGPPTAPAGDTAVAARLDRITANAPAVVFALDDEGAYTLARGRGLDALGFESDAVVGESVFDVYERYPTVLEHFERAMEGESGQFTVELEDGIDVEVWYQPVCSDGEVDQVVGLAQDVTEERGHRTVLADLLETSRALMDAPSREDVAEIVADAAQDVLGFDLTGVRLFDPETGTLPPVALTGPTRDQLGERPVYEVGEGAPGEVFVTGEPLLLSGSAVDERVPNAGAMRSALYYPMGEHGTISVGVTEPDAFDGTDTQVLALLATIAAAACTRAQRESEVREARRHTETVLERVNGLVENTVEVLVGARTREELEAGVAAELAATEPYEVAFVARPDVAGEQLEPSAWAGLEDVATDALAVPVDESDDPLVRAFRTGTVQVRSDLSAAGSAVWTGAFGAERAGSLVAVPLVYKDTCYGVLAAVAGAAGVFDERERTVLEALGRAVGNAINAVERDRILDTTDVVELELAIADEALLPARISRRVGCELSLADVDYEAEGSLRLYLSADVPDAEDFAETLATDDAVASATPITDGDGESLVDVRATDTCLELLTERGAVPREVVAADGTVRLTAELPTQAEARELFELFADRYDDVDLLGYHEHERPVQTRQEFRAALAERFTERQKTALRTAYYGGFFDWPRGADGTELAAAMDISRPTFHQHLRAAQRKVFDELYEE